MKKVRFTDGLIPTVEDFIDLQDLSIQHTNELLAAGMDADSSMQTLLPNQIGNISYGILDPNTMFQIQINASDLTKIDVINTDTRNGVAYTRILEKIYLENDQSSISLSDYNAGVRNYVCAKMEVITTAPQGATIYGTIENKRYDNVASIIVYSQDEFSALSSSDMDLIVCLGIVISNGVGSDLTESNIDNTNSYYGENRPQFSLRNHFHEKSLGSGIVTDSNIHGLALSDLLSSNDISVLPNVLIENRKGIYYGDYIQENISSYNQDLTGEITGVEDNWYITLAHFPKHIIYTVANSTELSAYLIPGTKYLDLGSIEPTSTPITVHYLYYNIAEPVINADTLDFNDPLTSEYFIVNGSFSDDFVSNSLTFIDSPNYNLDFDIILTKDKIFQKKPVTLISKVKLIDAAIYENLNVITEQTKIRLYPENLVVGNLATISVFGEDINENEVVENFEISNNQIYESTQYFAKIDKITVSTSSISINAILSIMSVIKYDQATDLLIANVNKNESGVLSKLIDKRPFSNTSTDPKIKIAAGLNNQEAVNYFRRNDVFKYYFHENFFSTDYTDFIRSKVYPKNGVLANGYWVSKIINTPEVFTRFKINFNKLSQINPEIYYSIDNGNNWIIITEDNFDQVITLDSGIGSIRFRLDTSNKSIIDNFIVLMYKQYDVNYVVDEIRGY